MEHLDTHQGAPRELMTPIPQRKSKEYKRNGASYFYTQGGDSDLSEKCLNTNYMCLNLGVYINENNRN